MRIRCKLNRFGDVMLTEIKVADIQELLSKYRLAAYNYMVENNVDHAVYATKEYNDDGRLTQLNLYQGYGFNDEEFYNRTDNIKGMVYACHAHK